jgi:hypothetical protein
LPLVVFARHCALKPPQLTALPFVDCCYDSEDRRHAAAVFRGLIARYQSAIAHLQRQQAQAAPATPGLVLTNIVASKGERAGQHTLMQLGMAKEDAAAVVKDPHLQAVVKAMRHFYENVQVGATLSFHVAPSP